MIAVIIPFKDRLEALENALQSIVNDDKSELEVCLCDDGSVRNPQAIYSRFEKSLSLRWVRNEVSQGPAAARNRAAELTSASVLAFLDSDDLWEKGKVALIESSLQINNWDILYHRMRSFRTEGNHTVWSKKIIGRELARAPKRDLWLNGNKIPLSGSLIKRAWFMEIGGFDEDPALRGIEDYDLWLRSSIAGAKISYLESLVGGYCIDGGIGSSPGRIRRIRRIFEKHSGRFTRRENILHRYRCWVEVATSSGDVGSEMLDDGFLGNQPLVFAPRWNLKHFLRNISNHGK